MTLNVPLAEKVLAMIDAHPEKHDQEYWLDPVCGTTACIAGHAMLASGEYVRKQAGPERRWRFVGTESGQIEENCSGEGARLLGLDHDIAYGIFLDMDEARAVERLRNLVHQAKHEAQHKAQHS